MLISLHLTCVSIWLFNTVSTCRSYAAASPPDTRDLNGAREFHICSVLLMSLEKHIEVIVPKTRMVAT
jgi:hypothetical protein